MSDTRTNVDSLRERIQSSSKLSDDDREILIEFSNTLYLLKSEYTDHRHEKLLRHCTRMAELVGGLAQSLTDRDAAENLVRWINTTYDNENTNHDYRTALRVFGDRVTDEEGIPDSIEWIPSGTSNSHNPVPNPADMLHWEEDVIPMIEGCQNSRDKALLAVAFDSGARSGELKELTIGDVTDHRHGMQIMLDGKTGQRSVSLIPSVPYIQRWLSDHPESNNRDAPLWSKLSTAEDVSYQCFLKIFKRAARKADIGKPATPTNFRKSNATYLAEKGMNESFINDRQGRARGSKATAHYVAKFGGRAEDEYARLQGVEVEEDEPEPIGPVTCPRCGNDTPRHEPACVHCQQVLGHGAIGSIEDEEREVREAFFRFAQKNPEVMSDFQTSRGFTDLLDSDPELFEDAQEFIQALAKK